MSDTIVMEPPTIPDNQEPEELQSLKTPEEKQIGAKILPMIAAKANAMAEANYAKKLDSAVDQLKTENQKWIETQMEEIRKANTPPDANDLEKLLSQEYLEVPVRLMEKSGRSTVEKSFVLRELPQATEQKFFKVIQKGIVPLVKEISSVEWTSSETVAGKLQKLIDAGPEILDTLADLCALCLDPFGEEGITKEWVQANMSSNRIVRVIDAQVQVSRLRDFFSGISQLFPR